MRRLVLDRVRSPHARTNGCELSVIHCSLLGKLWRSEGVVGPRDRKKKPLIPRKSTAIATRPIVTHRLARYLGLRGTRRTRCVDGIMVRRGMGGGRTRDEGHGHPFIAVGGRPSRRSAATPSDLLYLKLLSHVGSAMSVFFDALEREREDGKCSTMKGETRVKKGQEPHFLARSCCWL